MSISRTAFLASTVLVSTLALARAQAPTGGAEPPAARQGISIGVVDFAKVLDAYPRAIEERKKVDKFLEQCRGELGEQQRRINEIKLKREDLQRNTMDRDRMELELNQALRALDAMQEVLDRERVRRVEQYYVAVAQDVERAIALVAKDRGVQLVLRSHNDLLDGSTTSKARVFEMRQVWYAADEIDLTSAVIQRLAVPLPPEEPAKNAPKDQPKNDTQPKEATGGKPGD